MIESDPVAAFAVGRDFIKRVIMTFDFFDDRARVDIRIPICSFVDFKHDEGDGFTLKERTRALKDPEFESLDVNFQNVDVRDTDPLDESIKSDLRNRDDAIGVKNLSLPEDVSLRQSVESGSSLMNA